MMKKRQFNTWQLILSISSLACIAGIIAVFILIPPDFGFGHASIALFFIYPLIVALRIWKQRAAAHWRQLAYQVVLLCVASGGVVFVVRDWYATGMDDYHAEDVRWANFERQMRDDPAFKNVKVNLTDRKHIYWASGTLATEADRKRLDQLAAACGITDRQLDGPFVHSVSLIVESPNSRRQ